MPPITGTNDGETLTGGPDADQIEGLGGNDVLIGAGGDDTTDGGTGDDRHVVESAGDVVIERAGEGDDTVLASVSYTLAGGVHVEALTTANAAGTQAINLTGNELAQSIYGNAGNNVLTGGGGDDFLVGLGGNDTYFVDSASDTVAEAPGEGNDRVVTGISYTLAAGSWVETLGTNNAASTDALTLSGNEIANSIYGNAGNNVLNGGGGNDYLVGLEGNDYLVGGGGTDSMLGGTGNDTYSIDLAAGDRISFQDGAILRPASVVDPVDGHSIVIQVDLGGGASVTRTVDVSIVFGTDIVIESAGEGEDVIVARTSYQLRAGVPVETLVAVDGTAGITLRGNELANSLYGNDGNNLLFGGAGMDYLVGLAGNDTLDGGQNGDIMAGGTGNDSYLVDNESDRVIEAAGGGFDRIDTSISNYTLVAGSEVEVLAVAGGGAVNLYGNEFAQTIVGNSFNNRLSGGGGADTLNGGSGNDTYDVSDGHETIIEAAGGGNDLVYVSTDYTLNAGAQVETISTYWQYGDQDFDITGNELAQTIIGNFGSNTLDGGAGNDTLIGLGGADTFAFTTALGSGNVDWIADFETGIDIISLSQAIFAALPPGDLDPEALAIGSAASEADDRIIYNATTGALFYDADGSGSGDQIQFATLEPNLAIQASDFVVVAPSAAGAFDGDLKSASLSAARAAGASATTMAAVVAAAGMAAIPAAAKAPDGTGGEMVSHSLASSVAIGALETSDPGLAAASRMELGGETREAFDAVVAGSTNLAARNSNIDLSHDALARPDAVPASSLPQGTEVPLAGEPLAHALVANGVAMPSAEQLQALAGAPDAGEHSQLVGKVLADALAGGEAGGPIDALLDGLAVHSGAPTGVEYLAQLAAGFDAGHGEFTAAAWFHAGFAADAFGPSAEALAVHPDAVAQA